MKFSKIEQSATGSKDIGAFYGVNRTNKINDYQMSDMKNVDCESFPYLSTRRARKCIYDENEMAIICHDTDITDDYKVTGVTKDGNFVYRGEYFDVGGELSGNTSMCEYLGDYVLLPEKKYISVSTSIGADGLLLREATVEDFPKPCNDLLCEYCIGPRSLSNFVPALGEFFKVTSNSIKYSYYQGGFKSMREYCQYIIKNFHPGMFFKLKLMARNGKPAENMYTEYVCEIPDDIYMVIDEMYICKHAYNLNSVEKITYCYYGDERYGMDTLFTLTYEDYDFNDLVIKFSARRESTGELYDISKHFKQYVQYSCELKSVSVFSAGSANYNFSTEIEYWNDLYILPEFPVMLGGVYYNGRFFTYDNMGVDIYYSPSGNDSDKYDFSFGDSLAGAGAVSCADSGKWTALKGYNGALYAFKKNAMYRIYSSDGLNFYIEKVCDVGALNENAVCVVSDVMYFLSEVGFYRFTGTYPEELTDNLGRHYTHGVLGGYDNKVYASLEYSGGHELVVYDAQVSAYGVHDDFDVVNFVAYGGKLYGLDASDGHVYEMSGERESVEFSINTRKFFLGFDKKGINSIRMYFDYKSEPGEKFEVFVSYDDGEWERCFKPITSGKLKYVPIKFKKCDELSVKIEGNGVFTLKGMTLSLYSSGDIKQNK